MSPGGRHSTHNLIAALAAGQGGHVTTAQLEGLGISRAAASKRAEQGALIRVYNGVYAVGRLPATHTDRCHGALLACGKRSAIAHASAGAYWGILKRPSDPLHVAVVVRRRPQPGLQIHFLPKLMRSDVWTTAEGLRITSPARTLLDLTPTLDDKRLAWQSTNLRLRKLATMDDYLSVLRRNPRHPGAKRLAKAVGAEQEAPYRSPYELEWPPFAEKYGLPPYKMNTKLLGTRPDVLFTPDRLIVELDGWGPHSDKEAFEADRENPFAILAELDIPTVRITYDQFHADPAKQARQLHKILARRSGAAAPKSPHVPTPSRAPQRRKG
jgi:hypothetical protein